MTWQTETLKSNTHINIEPINNNNNNNNNKDMGISDVKSSNLVSVFVCHVILFHLPINDNDIFDKFRRLRNKLRDHFETQGERWGSNL